MKNFQNIWDERYAVTEYVYGTEPNVFFKVQLQRLPAGKLLLPGEGEGRNAVYAALNGWEVYAFDSSEQAKIKALKLARQKKVEIHYKTDSFETMSYPQNYFDVVALIFVHLPASVRKIYHHRLISFLKPGGMLISECFSKDQIANTSGGPRDLNMLYEPEELIKDFTGLKISMAEKREIMLNEGSLHQGKASVVRLVAVK